MIEILEAVWPRLSNSVSFGKQVLSPFCGCAAETVVVTVSIHIGPVLVS